MRLYKATSLQAYINQLKDDLVILQELASKELISLEYPITGANYDQYRDTIENHSEILSNHRDHLRSRKIRSAKEITNPRSK